MRYLVIGATSGIAKAISRIWVSRDGEAEFVLVGRNASALDAAAADLQVRNPNAKCQVFSLDLTDPTAIGRLESQLGSVGRIDVALLAHGELTDQTLAQTDPITLANSLTVNATSVAVLAEMSARLMEKSGGGKLVVIGSVAGDRGRKTNYSYGAAKALLDTYVRGMQHRFAGGNVQPILIKPGPTATPMTAGMPGASKMASPDKVAADIVKGIDGDKATVYTPGIWKLIMLVVRMIPAPIFNKLNF